MENFTLTPIFALHSKNGIGLPDCVTVARLFLVQFVLVRIQVRQPKKEEAATKVAVFLFYEGVDQACLNTRMSKIKKAVLRTAFELLHFMLGFPYLFGSPSEAR